MQCKIIRHVLSSRIPVFVAAEGGGRERCSNPQVTSLLRDRLCKSNCKLLLNNLPFDSPTEDPTCVRPRVAFAITPSWSAHQAPRTTLWCARSIRGAPVQSGHHTDRTYQLRAEEPQHLPRFCKIHTLNTPEELLQEKFRTLFVVRRAIYFSQCGYSIRTRRKPHYERNPGEHPP